MFKDLGMIFIGLGSNLPSCAGPPRQTLAAALARLAEHGITLCGVSGFYESAPLETPDPQPAYVNAVAAIASGRTPEALLDCLLGIEAAFGRMRSRRRAARTLDLDLLDWKGVVRPDAALWRAVAEGREEGARLLLPHPRLHRRRFVLAPLAEIAPDWRHPVFGTSIPDLLQGVGDQQLERLP